MLFDKARCFIYSPAQNCNAFATKSFNRYLHSVTLQLDPATPLMGAAGTLPTPVTIRIISLTICN